MRFFFAFMFVCLFASSVGLANQEKKLPRLEQALALPHGEDRLNSLREIATELISLYDDQPQKYIMVEMEVIGELTALQSTQKSQQEFQELLDKTASRYGKKSLELAAAYTKVAQLIFEAVRVRTGGDFNVRARRSRRPDFGIVSGDPPFNSISGGRPTNTDADENLRLIRFAGRQSRKAKGIAKKFKGREADLVRAKLIYDAAYYAVRRKTSGRKTSRFNGTQLKKAIQLLEKHEQKSSMVLELHAILAEGYSTHGFHDSSNKHSATIATTNPEYPDQPWKLLFPAKPEYPRDARASLKEGHVVVQITIDETGFAKSPSIVQSFGHEKFEVEVLKAIEKFRFSPQYTGGTPVETTGVTYKFTFELID